jgi:hypothetical protein
LVASGSSGVHGARARGVLIMESDRYVLISRDEHPEPKGVRRAAIAFFDDGSVAVRSGMDTGLLAGVDVPYRLFRRVCHDHRLFGEKRSGAFAPADERGTCRREGAGSENHHVFRVAGIYRSAGDPRARSPPGVVPYAALLGAGGRWAAGAGLDRDLFCLQGKYLHLRYHRTGSGPESHFHRPLCVGASPDVWRRLPHAARHPRGARVMVGRAGLRRDHTRGDMEVIGRGKIPGPESSGLCRVPGPRAISSVADGW